MDFTPATSGRIGFKMIFALVVGMASLVAMVYAQPASQIALPPHPEAVAADPDDGPEMGGPAFRHYNGPDARANPHHVRMVSGESAAVDPT